ncbi:amidohydrolase [Jeotgalibacillus soli]|uniref:Peptidase M20 n=1 Tax=Jeotgalibacillus soli TaxID=889306 RepID=A0A0C2VZN1_9BACL|nr:amidohydrolase [Jeotgalibacillus soli]KIL49836.1 peptidase M20 [Jeotgalibacillus soli]
MEISEENQKNSLIKWRRTLHQIPEVGFTEFQTTYFLAKMLDELGWTVTVGKEVMNEEARYGVPRSNVLEASKHRARNAGIPEAFLEKLAGGFTGVVATLDSGRTGQHAALRFDIDALPIDETTNENHLPNREGFASTHPGEMHACGHDAHAAIGLGVAQKLSSELPKWNGKVTLLFQPAEEGSRGAKAMVANGWLDGVDLFLSGHVGIRSLAVGQVAASSDQILATTKLDVTFKGVAAHAGVEPEKGKNALLAAASAAVQLLSLPKHPGGTTRLNVGSMKAGRGRNIIPDEAVMEVETRGETTILNQWVVTQAEHIIREAAQQYEVEVLIDYVGEGETAASDLSFAPLLERAAENSGIITEVFPVQPLGGSEDASVMMNYVRKKGGKATYMIFGTPLASGHHQPDFDIDEHVLQVGVDVYTRLIYQTSKELKENE